MSSPRLPPVLASIAPARVAKGRKFWVSSPALIIAAFASSILLPFYAIAARPTFDPELMARCVAAVYGIIFLVTWIVLGRVRDSAGLESRAVALGFVIGQALKVTGGLIAIMVIVACLSNPVGWVVLGVMMVAGSKSTK